jgi:hypothetical protein
MPIWARLALVGALALSTLGACSDDDGSAEELCAALADTEGRATLFADFDPTDADAALDRLRLARVQLGELQAAAPRGVRDALQTEIDYVQALVDALEEVPPGDATAAATAVQGVTDDHPEVQAAADELESFVAREC